MFQQAHRVTAAVEKDVGGLVHLSVQGLARMFDLEKQLFCYRLKGLSAGLEVEGLSHRYTMMSLLGLHRLEAAGIGRSPVNVRSTLAGLCRSVSWIDNIGDLGLLLWLCAVVSPGELEACYRTLDVPEALSHFSDAREKRTMELAWFLSGLAHAAMAGGYTLPGLTDLAVRTYSYLVRNQGDYGIFGHIGTNASFSGVIRGRIGSFADQVYPIYALAKFGQVFQNQQALERAQVCAEVICRAQGTLGQWWWHYDAGTGKVCERYPVYSVHQDGMAPMALLAVSEATGLDFSEFLYRGLAWIHGQNELDLDLRDTSRGLIWRCIYRQKSYKMYSDELKKFLWPQKSIRIVPDLMVLYECRPYHLGWLLYAFAGQQRPSCV